MRFLQPRANMLAYLYSYRKTVYREVSIVPVAFMLCDLIIVSILCINIQCMLYGYFGLAL